MSDERPDEIPETDWPEILRAAGQDTSAHAAKGVLLDAYRPVLYWHVVSRWRQNSQDADDLVQEFITKRFLTRNLFAHADPARGRFSNLLLTALDNFCRDEFKRRRSPVMGLVEDDVPAKQVPAFDQVWAQAVIVNALRGMRDECQRNDQAAIWLVFFERELEPLVKTEKRPSFEELANRCGVGSAKEASNLHQTAVRKLRRHLRAVTAEYVREGEDVDIELRELWRILSQPSLGRELSFENHSSLMTPDLWSSVRQADSRAMGDFLRDAIHPADDELRQEFEVVLRTPLRQVLTDIQVKVPELDQLNALPTVSVRESLSDRSDIRTLNALKRVFRHRANHVSDHLEKAVADVLYAACIAAALVYHGKLISSLTSEELTENWRLAAKFKWLDEGTRDLLESACRQQSD